MTDARTPRETIEALIACTDSLGSVPIRDADRVLPAWDAMLDALRAAAAHWEGTDAPIGVLARAAIERATGRTEG